MAGDVVGCLEVQNAGSDQDETQDGIEIRGNEEFYLGRNPNLCRRHWSDPTISNRHLRIHCVLYDGFEEEVLEVPPFVYVTDVSTNGTFVKKRATTVTEAREPLAHPLRLRRTEGAYLLEDGDELQLSNTLSLIFRAYVSTPQDVLTNIQQHETKRFDARYGITNRVLGIGGFGTVVAAIHRKTQRQLACKIINLVKIRSSFQNQEEHADGNSPGHGRCRTRLQTCFREFDIVKDLSHPNIITIEKVFWSSNTIYILQQLITGGDLFSFIEFKGGVVGDVETALIVRQILLGVKYLHDQDIVHRDLKPDNILMTSLDDTARVVITDFGSARFLPNATSSDYQRNHAKRRMFSLCGTLEYTAPEVHKMNKTIPESEGYSASIDMWSIGCITAAMLSGDHLFVERNSQYDCDPMGVILGLSSKCDISVMDDPANFRWSTVAQPPKDFIKQLLVLEEDCRLTVDEALAHRWFSNQHYAAELDALYNRAVSTWRPRRKVFNLVEPIPPGGLQDKGPVGVLGNSVISHFFAPPTNQQPYQKTKGSPDESRERPSLPKIPEDAENAMEDVQYQPDDSWVAGQSFASGRQLLPPDELDHSMDQLTLDHGRTYVVRDSQSSAGSGPTTPQEFHGHSPELGESPIDQPQTPHPQRISTSSIVYETPIPFLKRRRSPIFETPGRGLLYDRVSQETASNWVSAKYFAAEVEKRRKVGQSVSH